MRFSLPDSWKDLGGLTGTSRKTRGRSRTRAGRRLILHFGGVDNAFFAWVNGVLVSDTRYLL